MKSIKIDYKDGKYLSQSPEFTTVVYSTDTVSEMQEVFKAIFGPKVKLEISFTPAAINSLYGLHKV